MYTCIIALALALALARKHKNQNDIQKSKSANQQIKKQICISVSFIKLNDKRTFKNQTQ